MTASVTGAAVRRDPGPLGRLAEETSRVSESARRGCEGDQLQYLHRLYAIPVPSTSSGPRRRLQKKQRESGHEPGIAKNQSLGLIFGRRAL